MKKLLNLITLLLLTTTSFTQIADYSFSAVAGSFTPISGGTDLNAIEVDDALSSAISIGFTFDYDGSSYTQVKISSNGWVTFNTGASSSTTSNDLDYSSTAIRPLLAPLWDDLDGASGNGGQAKYKTSGTSPNRIFTIECIGWQWNYATSNQVISYQVILYETTNAIEFVYQQEAGAVNSGSGSIGITASGTGSGNFLSLNGTGVSPSASSTTETSNLNTKPATGQIYRFSPPSCLNPSALTASNITSGSADLGWTDNAGASLWDIELGINGFSPTGAPTQSGVTNSYTYAGLSAATSYDYYVRADCGGSDYSAWTGPYNFTTPCAAYIPPYLQEFVTFIPACWDEANAGTPATGPSSLGSGGWVADGFANVGTTEAVKINLYNTGDNDWLISPQIDLTSGGPYQLEFDFAIMIYGSSTVAGTLGSDDKVHILITNDGGTTWTALQVWDNTSTVAIGGEHFLYDLSAYSGSLVQFAFWATEGSVDDAPDNDISVDNFEVSSAAPMTYTSSTCTQTNTSDVKKGVSDAEVIGIEIVTAGSVSAFDLTELEINITGTTDINDITNITVYYTYGTSTFSAVNPFGTATPAGGSITVSGVQQLQEGTNYFWIAYDISGSATLDNYIDAECTSITMNGGVGVQAPTTTIPGGNRKIIDTAPDDPWPGQIIGTINCQNAPYTFSGSTSGANNDCTCSSSGDHTYSFNLATASDIRISLCNGSTSWDTYMYIYPLSGDCDVSGDKIASNYSCGSEWSCAPYNCIDNDCSAGGCDDTKQSQITIDSLLPGDYVVVVEGSASAEGPYELSIDLWDCDTTMIYLSSTFTQYNSSNVFPGETNEDIGGLEIMAYGVLTPLEVTELAINMNGTTDLADVDNIDIYFTGLSPSYAATNLYGSISPATGTLNVTGTQILSEGNNYFWIVYDMNAAATAGNFIDTECTSVTIAGAKSVKIPTITSTTWSRPIPYTYIMADDTESTCAGVFYDSGGAAGDYQNDEDYVKTLCSDDPAKQIMVEFTSWDVEITWDWLKVYDGTSTSDPLIATYTAINIPQVSDISTAGCLTYQFHSNINFPLAGWEADISCVSPPEGGCAGSPAAAGDDCLSAPLVNMNGYCWNTGDDGTDPYTMEWTPNDWCDATGQTDAGSWVSFVAEASRMDFYIWPSNCSSWGIQVQFYDMINCASPSSSSNIAVSPCFESATPSGITAYAEGLTIGNTYYMLMDGWGGSDCDYMIAVKGMGLLPVDILNYDAYCVDEGVEVSWSTANEKNNDFFTIERSPDGREFEVIGYVGGAGNTNIIHEYRFIDENPSNDVGYYRIKQTDFDGQYEYFDVIPMTCEGSESEPYIYPNPFNETIYVNFPNSSGSKSMLEIKDQLGRTVYTRVIEPETFELEINPEKSLPSGIYIIKIINDQTSYYKSLIKIK